MVYHEGFNGLLMAFNGGLNGLLMVFSGAKSTPMATINE